MWRIQRSFASRLTCAPRGNNALGSIGLSQWQRQVAGVERGTTRAEVARGRQGIVLRVARREDDGSRGGDGRQLQSALPGHSVSDPPAETVCRAASLLRIQTVLLHFRESRN